MLQTFLKLRIFQTFITKCYVTSSKVYLTSSNYEKYYLLPFPVRNEQKL